MIITLLRNFIAQLDLAFKFVNRIVWLFAIDHSDNVVQIFLTFEFFLQVFLSLFYL